MGKFKDAKTPQDQLWALVEADPQELQADDVENIANAIDDSMRTSDPNLRRDTDLHSPLSYAVLQGKAKLPVVWAIVSSRNFEPTVNTAFAVFTAAKFNNMKALEMTLRTQSQKELPSTEWKFYLQKSIKIALDENNVEMVQLLLNYGATWEDISDKETLRFAMHTKQTMFLRAFLSELKDINFALAAVTHFMRENKIEMDKVIPTVHQPIFIQYVESLKSSGGLPVFGVLREGKKSNDNNNANSNNNDNSIIARLTENSFGLDQYLSDFLGRAQNRVTNEAAGDDNNKNLLERRLLALKRELFFTKK